MELSVYDAPQQEVHQVAWIHIDNPHLYIESMLNYDITFYQNQFDDGQIFF